MYAPPKTQSLVGLSWAPSLRKEIEESLSVLSLVEVPLVDSLPEKAFELMGAMEATGVAVALHAAGWNDGLASIVEEAASRTDVRHLSLELKFAFQPSPFCPKGTDEVCRRLEELRGSISTPLLLENAIPPARGVDPEVRESRYLNLLAKRTGCKLSLDLARLYTSATNRCFNPYDWLDELDLREVRAIHVSGTHFTEDGIVVNDRSLPVAKAVWDLYRYVCKQIRPVETTVQWTDRCPPLRLVQADMRRAEEILRETAMYHFDLKSLGAPYQDVLEGGVA